MEHYAQILALAGGLTALVILVILVVLAVDGWRMRSARRRLFDNYEAHEIRLRRLALGLEGQGGLAGAVELAAKQEGK